MTMKSTARHAGQIKAAEKAGGQAKGRRHTHHVDPIRAIPFPAFAPKFDPQTEKLVYSNMTKAATRGFQLV
jgi:hypothetical protein